MLMIGGSMHGKEFALRHRSCRVSIPVMPPVKVSWNKRPGELLFPGATVQDYSIRRFRHVIMFKLPELGHPDYFRIRQNIFDHGLSIEQTMSAEYGVYSIIREYLVFEDGGEGEMQSLVEGMVYGPGF